MARAKKLHLGRLAPHRQSAAEGQSAASGWLQGFCPATLHLHHDPAPARLVRVKYCQAQHGIVTWLADDTYTQLHTLLGHTKRTETYLYRPGCLHYIPQACEQMVSCVSHAKTKSMSMPVAESDSHA